MQWLECVTGNPWVTNVVEPANCIHNSRISWLDDVKRMWYLPAFPNVVPKRMHRSLNAHEVSQGGDDHGGLLLEQATCFWPPNDSHNLLRYLMLPIVACPPCCPARSAGTGPALLASQTPLAPPRPFCNSSLTFSKISRVPEQADPLPEWEGLCS